MNSILIILAIIILAIELVIAAYRTTKFGSIFLAGKLLNKYGYDYIGAIVHIAKYRVILLLITLSLLIGSFLF